MSIPEAAKLVLQAGLIGSSADIFLLHMGDPVSIIHLAKNMIKLSGFNTQQIRIKITGLRFGEKLYEELLSKNETLIKTPHKKLNIVKSPKVNMIWVRKLLVWINTLDDKDEVSIKKELKIWVKGYKPQYIKKDV